MHGDPEPVLRQAEHLGDEFPRPADGLFLEVIAEAEVAEHLEERVMAGGVADVLQVVVLAAGAHAALHAHARL
jgi:Xaa-Pro aminopeptidase